MGDTFLSIGSNSGDRLLNLNRSLEEIEGKAGKIVARSPVYESRSWGYEGQDFLNMVIKIETQLSPLAILRMTQQIEKNAGRIKTPGQYSDRSIDLDILFYDHLIIKEEELTIPHPRLHERLFVLVPLMDIEPDYIHPTKNKTITQLFNECTDEGWIRPFSK
ncbi:MAG TPA: 2-amino-4-hydroxy-6-hydroxymethyldihydropteridine diphosphokinase [Bacteroidales bacterium]|nr:2-amino-4-hydroxy-6-hydroxymethyldihydropteridine diphosphokinase [Bacteroidales bacterium]